MKSVVVAYIKGWGTPVIWIDFDNYIQAYRYFLNDERNFYEYQIYFHREGMALGTKLLKCKLNESNNSRR